MNHFWAALSQGISMNYKREGEEMKNVFKKDLSRRILSFIIESLTNCQLAWNMSSNNGEVNQYRTVEENGWQKYYWYIENYYLKNISL